MSSNMPFTKGCPLLWLALILIWWSIVLRLTFVYILMHIKNFKWFKCWSSEGIYWSALRHIIWIVNYPEVANDTSFSTGLQHLLYFQYRQDYLETFVLPSVMFTVICMGFRMSLFRSGFTLDWVLLIWSMFGDQSYGSAIRSSMESCFGDLGTWSGK